MACRKILDLKMILCTMTTLRIRERHLRQRESSLFILGSSSSDDDIFPFQSRSSDEDVVSDSARYKVDRNDTTTTTTTTNPHNSHHSAHHRHYTASYSAQNHTITTSVSIRVTPLHDYFVSWGILWACCLVVACLATCQVVTEYRAMSAARRRPRSSSTRTTASTNNGKTGYVIVEVNHPEAAGDGESVSTADLTRSMVRRLLLLAMLTRVVAIPVEIFVDPMWWQFVGDTLPEMVFASAWTVLVTFFVQLVGVATGTGTNTSPGLVITLTAYAVYMALIVLQLFNKVASVLLYALLCCIYATLLGVVLYFCPILLSLLYRSSGPAGHDSYGNGSASPGPVTTAPTNRTLSTRLSLSTAVCIFVFAAHTVRYARLVVAPPCKVYWWYQYGVLELFPALIFLILMQPNPSKVDRNVPNSPAQPPERRPSSDGIRRVDSDVRRIDDPFALSAITMSIGSSSGVSGSASQQRREQAPLSKDFATAGISDTGYGSTSTAQVDTKL